MGETGEPYFSKMSLVQEHLESVGRKVDVQREELDELIARANEALAHSRTVMARAKLRKTYCEHALNLARDRFHR